MALDQVEARAPAQPVLPRAVCARQAGIVAAVLLVGSGLFFAWHAFEMPFGSDGVPGPGFFPFFLGVLLAGAAAVIGCELVRAKPNGQRVELGHRDVMVTLAALLLAPVFFERLGTYVTLGLLIASLLILVGRVSVLRAGLASATAMVVFWYFFKELLGLQLPAGPF